MFILRIVLVAVILPLSSCGIKLAKKPSRTGSELYRESYSPLIIAHRGFSNKAPENTLSAFRLASAAGSDVVELDFYVSKDHIPVVVHDRYLDRTTNSEEKFNEVRIRPRDLTYSEIEELDAGTWFSEGFTNESVPTLKAAINAIKEWDAITLIEHKDGEVEDLLGVVNDFDDTKDYFVQSFNWDFLEGFAKEKPHTPVYALGHGEITKDLLRDLKKRNIHGLSWREQNVTPESVDLAHSMGFSIFAYTVNNIVIAKRLILMKVDGIITDNPAKVKTLIEDINGR